MGRPYKVFHSRCESIRQRVHFAIVRPEQPGNIGSIVRALSNMGLWSPLWIIGDRSIVTAETERLAKHSKVRLSEMNFVSSLDEALRGVEGKILSIAATARAGSSKRPHPLSPRDASLQGVEKLKNREIDHLFFIFGPESDGLTNEEIELCDWIVSIPSVAEYRSLNLSHAVMLLAYECHVALLGQTELFAPPAKSQKQRLIGHFIRLAEEVGFVLPGDPHKMRPRLEKILAGLPNHVEHVRTLHGLLDQTIRSLRKGAPDIKGRYRYLTRAKETLSLRDDLDASKKSGVVDDQQ